MFSLFFPFSVCDGIILLTVDLGEKENVQVSVTCLHYRLLMTGDLLCTVAQSQDFDEQVERAIGLG